MWHGGMGARECGPPGVDEVWTDVGPAVAYGSELKSTKPRLRVHWQCGSVEVRTVRCGRGVDGRRQCIQLGAEENHTYTARTPRQCAGMCV
eukprot:354884-Chlamydomonas_euryale.AAC.2